MNAQDNEVNRNIDSETAEGHRVRDKVMLGESEDPGKRTNRKNAALDDEAEGHRKLF